MDAASIVNFAKAARLDASSLANRIAVSTGSADDVMAARITSRITDLADDLDLLAGHSAQVAVGPTVNVATEARLLLGSLDRSVPFQTPSPEALQGVERLLSQYAQLAQGWVNRAS